MYRRILFVRLAFFLSLPFLATQATLAKLPSAPSDAQATCSRVGEVLGRDVFSQTFLLKPKVGPTKTIPFSRWTGFFKISGDSQNGRLREIEPTDVRLGDQLCVLLDSSEASATMILVVEQASSSKLATSKTSGGRGGTGL